MTPGAVPRHRRLGAAASATAPSFSIRWGNERDLLFGYGEAARFRLDPAGTCLLCVPAEPDSLAWQRVLLSRVLPLVALARGYEALHAGAVETVAGVVAIVGPSGAGKSTLVRELLRRGHRLFADDVLVIGSGSAGTGVLAHPSGPYLSLAEEDAPPPGQALGALGGKLWLAIEGAAQQPRPLAAVAILEREQIGTPAAEPIPPSPLALAPFMLGLPDEEGRDAERFSTYSDLVDGAALLRLVAGEEPAPRLADALEAALERHVVVAGGRA